MKKLVILRPCTRAGVKNAARKHTKTADKLKAVSAELAEVLPVVDAVTSAYEDTKRDFGFTGCRYSEAVSNASEKLQRMLDAIPSLNEEVEMLCSNDRSFKQLSDEEKERKKKEKRRFFHLPGSGKDISLCELQFTDWQSGYRKKVYLAFLDGLRTR